MQIIIYLLKDPITNEIRYIGRTKKVLSKRLSEHISTSKSKSKTHKSHWINFLLNKQKKPIIEPLLLLNCSWEKSHLIEKEIIKLYLSKGFKLTNSVDRGAGNALGTFNVSRQKAVLQYNLNGSFINEYPSILAASKAVGGRLKGIHKCLNLGKTAYNFQWKYKTSDSYPLNISAVNKKERPSTRIKVNQYDLEGNFIKTWDSILAAKKYTQSNNIVAVCKGAQKTSKGFIWKYVTDEN